MNFTRLRPAKIIGGHDDRRTNNLFTLPKLSASRAFARMATTIRAASNNLGYFCWIGGAIFSAGAGGSAAFAPSFCACGSGLAGWGAGVVGRWPPGLDSAGALS